MSTSTETKFTSPEFATHAETASDPEVRIRAAFGLRGGRLPEVNRQTLRTYYRYLSTRMSFPFEARYPEEVVGDEHVRQVSVLELLDPAGGHGDPSLGLVCRTRIGSRLAEVPLADLEVAEASLNYQLVEDYWYWFWNWGY